MVENHNADVEDVIIQGLSNQERRNILKIIKLAKEGAIYSDIMGELKLNSGSLNYHLRQLEGLITKNKQGRYILTPLGEKALLGLYSMTENLENGYEEYLNKAKVRQKRTPYPVLAGTLTIFASCVSCVLGIIGTGMSVSLFNGSIYSDNRGVAWLFIPAFAIPCFVLGLKAGISTLRRNRFAFSLTVISLLLVPAVASTVTFKVTGGGWNSMGALLALTLGLPMAIFSILSVFFILMSKTEFADDA